MAISAEISEVTTSDAASAESPYKISAQSTKNVLKYKLTLTATSVIRAIRVRLKPTNRNTGKLLYSRGMVCGTGDRCGSPTSRSLSMPSGTVVSDEIEKSELGAEPDGAYEVKAYAVSSADGWST